MTDREFDLLELLYRAGVLDHGARKRVSESQKFGNRSLHVGQILIMQDRLTPSELKFDLDTLEAANTGQMTIEEAVIVVRKHHDGN